MINLAISDDHRLVTQGLENMISKSGIADIVAEASDITETEQVLKSHKDLDILLLDISMPGGNSLDFIPQWIEKYPAVNILVISSYAEAAVIRRALERGAKGYVLKTASEEELLEAINTVSKGETYLCVEAADILRNKPKEEPIELTPREREVLRLVAEGLSIKMIADRLGLGFETVHSYFKYLKLKLGVNNTAAMVRVAMEQKLI